ncbi:hypothetical protein [Streptomyces gibsoniae]|uniref:Uncharacterized protein n=1 Tax=Streptomyces gibsoniae TaxID=3075529 RepID=A0ABU2TZK2_9ACTN|nr:hypothetical protein [Streptomyces sp. DSM 41699]MDT0466363.1 hypothetical protein [Streptomyces sp. DSM 41699]
MKTARFSTPTAVALLLGMTAVVGPGAADAHAASDIPLPIAHFAHMVVDAPHGHLFISGGAGTDGILVTDLDGGNPTTIGGEPGATGLALSDDGSLVRQRPVGDPLRDLAPHRDGRRVHQDR